MPSIPEELLNAIRSRSVLPAPPPVCALADGIRATYGEALQALLVTLFVFITAPVSANLLAQAALHLGVPSRAGAAPAVTDGPGAPAGGAPGGAGKPDGVAAKGAGRRPRRAAPAWRDRRVHRPA